MSNSFVYFFFPKETNIILEMLFNFILNNPKLFFVTLFSKCSRKFLCQSADVYESHTYIAQSINLLTLVVHV
jgi:hypothetical protein